MSNGERLATAEWWNNGEFTVGVHADAAIIVDVALIKCQHKCIAKVTECLACAHTTFLRATNFPQCNLFCIMLMNETNKTSIARALVNGERIE